MSTIVGLTLSGSELYLLADTIVTSVVPLDGAPARSGVTSHGERFQPIVQDGSVVSFTESACKIGKVNAHCAVGVATNDVSFAFECLELVFAQKSIISEVISLTAVLVNVAASLSPASHSRGTRVSLLFALAGKEQSLLRATLEVMPDGSVNCSSEHRLITPSGTFFQIVEGAGAQYFQNEFIAKELVEQCHHDPTLLGIGSQLLCKEYSRRLRGATDNQAISVGGAFLGYMIDANGVQDPRDTLHLEVGKDGCATYLVKIAYDGELVFITDYLRRHVVVVRTLPDEVAAWRIPPSKNVDITDRYLKGAKLAAPVCLVANFESADAERPVVSIVESQSENALTFNDGVLPPGLTWPEYDSEFTFKSASNTLTFKIPHPV